MAPPSRGDISKLHILMIPHKGTGGSGVRSASADTKPKPAASCEAAHANGAEPYQRLVSTASKRSCSSADARLKVKERMQKPPSIPVVRGGAAVSKMTPAYINEFWQKRENVRSQKGVAPAVTSQEKENAPRVASATRAAPVIMKAGPKLMGTKIEPKKVAPSPAPLGTHVPQRNQSESASPQSTHTKPVVGRRPSPTQHGRPLSPSPAVKLTTTQQTSKPPPKTDGARLQSPSRTLALSPAKKESSAPQAIAAKRPVIAGRKVVVGSGAKPKPKPKHADPAAEVAEVVKQAEVSATEDTMVVFTPKAEEAEYTTVQ